MNRVKGMKGAPAKRAPGAEFVRVFVRAVRERPGWFTAVVGALLCVLGWYGVSGETLTARQLPYLASGTVPGAALIVAGAVLVAARSPGRGGAPELTDRRVEVLYTLLVEQPDGPGAAEPTRGEDESALLALPEGTLYHRPGCQLVAGKERAGPVAAAGLRERGLTPCPVCDPAPPPSDATPPDVGRTDAGRRD
ncbi:hypothetical protein [Kitasatospora sp. MAP5-34]|uniref:hypothetical protein n=1 Tax=Kitasatospora sp. MAP5-34 TaxID=3035102 RepID=UPI00247311EA|nr:hypothetical protein [Kitasatospora sp. MAP5-34]